MLLPIRAASTARAVTITGARVTITATGVAVRLLNGENDHNNCLALDKGHPFATVLKLALPVPRPFVAGSQDMERISIGMVMALVVSHTEVDDQSSFLCRSHRAGRSVVRMHAHSQCFWPWG